MILALQVQGKSYNLPIPTIKPKPKWSQVSDQHKQNYTERLLSLEQLFPPPQLHCQSVCRCRDKSCCDAIQQEYDFLIQCLKIADHTLPRFKPGVEKDWWSEELSNLRNKSISIHNLWVTEGRPRQGPTHEERLHTRGDYKHAIRAAQRAPKQKCWDRLHTELISSSTNSFCKSWKKIYNKNKGHLASVVDGCSSGPAIANRLKESFQKNSTPNNRENVSRLDQQFTTRYSEYVDNHTASCDCKLVYITPENVMDGLLNMKCNKAQMMMKSRPNICTMPVICLHSIGFPLQHDAEPCICA